jgi:hypothetical protein
MRRPLSGGGKTASAEWDASDLWRGRLSGATNGARGFGTVDGGRGKKPAIHGGETHSSG